MRNFDLMVRLLEEMAAKPDGRIILVNSFGMSEERLERRHHAENLCDAGRVEWESEHVFRITNEGYDFLAALKKNPRLRDKAKKLIAQGESWLAMFEKITSLVDKI
ncbi:MAG: hypothetical protein OXM58_16430 [Rhodospirillaceae bacterium]|nr:hypothetical protein [Rhodospirillaceae bacterium]MDE0619861.1 hypothetical protein [Rhodospirillaceae bacterium]